MSNSENAFDRYLSMEQDSLNYLKNSDELLQNCGENLFYKTGGREKKTIE